MVNETLSPDLGNLCNIKSCVHDLEQGSQSSGASLTSRPTTPGSSSKPEPTQYGPIFKVNIASGDQYSGGVAVLVSAA